MNTDGWTKLLTTFLNRCVCAFGSVSFRVDRVVYLYTLLTATVPLTVQHHVRHFICVLLIYYLIFMLSVQYSTDIQHLCSVC